MADATSLPSAMASPAIPAGFPGSRRLYRYAGRNVDSQLPLQELPHAPLEARDSQLRIVQLTVQPVVVAAQVNSRHTWPDPAGNPSILGERWRDGRYCLRFPGVAAATIDDAGTTIELWQDPHASVDSARHVLLDQVLPRALALQGTLMLHGSAVATPGGRLLVFLGDSGRGKSTLATGFDLFGGMALTDDSMALDTRQDRVRVFPGYPGLRLWPDSMTALLEHRRDDALPMAHYSSKRRIPPAVLSDHVPLHEVDAFVVLQAPGEHRDATLTSQTRQQGCIGLISNSFQVDPTDLRHVHRLLGVASDVARRVPMYTLHHPRDYAALPDVVARISAHFDSEPVANISTG